jgi:hypothetical protein
LVKLIGESQGLKLTYSVCEKFLDHSSININYLIKSEFKECENFFKVLKKLSKNNIDENKTSELNVSNNDFILQNCSSNFKKIKIKIEKNEFEKKIKVLIFENLILNDNNKDEGFGIIDEKNLENENKNFIEPKRKKKKNFSLKKIKFNKNFFDELENDVLLNLKVLFLIFLF